MSDIIRDWWGVILAALGGVAWLVRMEAKMLRNEEAIRRLEERRKEERREVLDKLSTIEDDIKTLLQRSN